MITEEYDLHFDGDYKSFKFISEGPKGSILKSIQYEETPVSGVYNLGFGDVNVFTNEIDDLVVTNNGDSQKVLSTVARTLYLFTDHYPDVFIYARGSTRARTRLYRIGITNNILLIEKDFHILGIKSNDVILFEKNATYDGFLVKRKSSILGNMKVKKTKSKLPKRRSIEPQVPKKPQHRHDPELDKIAHISWFPKKVAQAGEALKNIKLPNL